MAGTVTGVRYYKSDLNIGPHTGSLWSSTGTRLATVTFTNESGVGWQTASFSSPVAITAGTTYVVSYHTNYGHYAATGPYFASPVTNGPLTAPANAGVYTYNSASAFPSSTFNAANYWVDVLFNPAGANTAPTAVADTANATEKGGIANGSGGSPATGNVLTNDTDPDAGDTKTVTAVRFGATNGTLGTALAGAHGSLVLNAAGAFTYTVNETDAAVQALRQSTDTLTDVFSYTMRDTAGATSTASLTVSIHGANDAPVLAVQTGSQNAVVGSAFSLTLPAGTFTDVDAGDTLTYSATAADGSPLPSWLAFNSSTRTFSGTPTAANVGTLSIKVSATDLGSLVASETFNIVVTTTPDAAPTAVADTADATEKGGIANGSGGSPASGNVLTNDTDPDAGDTKTVTAVRFGATAGTLGTALAGAHGSLVLNASGDLHLHRQRDGCRRAGLAAIDRYADRRLQLHHARYGRRHIHDDAHGQHSRRQRRAGACGADRQPERGRRLGLLSDAARRHLHRRRCRRHSHLHGDRRRRLAASLLADFQRLDTHIQRHAGGCKCRHAQRQGFGHRSRRPRRQRDLQYRRDDGPRDGQPVHRVQYAGADQSE